MGLVISIILNVGLVLAVIGLYFFGLHREKKLSKSIEDWKSTADIMERERDNEKGLRGITENNCNSRGAELARFRVGYVRLAMAMFDGFWNIPGFSERDPLFDHANFPSPRNETFRFYHQANEVDRKVRLDRLAAEGHRSIVEWTDSLVSTLTKVTAKLNERLGKEIHTAALYEHGLVMLLSDLAAISTELNRHHDGNDLFALRAAIRAARRRVDANFVYVASLSQRRENGTGWLTSEAFGRLLAEVASADALADSYKQRNSDTMNNAVMLGVEHRDVLRAFILGADAMKS